jgi:hypothetical protein
LAFNNREIRAIQEGNGSLKFIIPHDLAAGAGNARFVLSNVQGRLIRSWSIGLEKDAVLCSGRLPPGIYCSFLTAGPKRYFAKAVVYP